MGLRQKDGKDCLVGCVEKDPLVKLKMHGMVTKQCFAICWRHFLTAGLTPGCDFRSWLF